MGTIVETIFFWGGGGSDFSYSAPYVFNPIWSVVVLCEAVQLCEQARLMFANLSMLDVSNNSIKIIPVQIRPGPEHDALLSMVLFLQLLHLHVLVTSQ
jgi:hypothetical protein